MQSKVCTKCKVEKSLDSFWDRKDGKFGKRADCIECQKSYHKKYHSENREARVSQSREYYKNNREKVIADNIAHRQKPEVKAARRKRDRHLYKTDINFRLGQRLRIRINAALKAQDGEKHTKCLDNLGCTMEQFKTYLESHFQEGMSWDNYGNPNGDHSNCWHIDHTIPCSKFDLKDPSQVSKCFHYSNLKPMWAKDNLRKWAN